MQLSGKTALVTGGASGLGEAVVKRFVGLGARVAILDRNAARGAALAEASGGKAIFIETDVVDGASAERAAAEAAEAFGPPQICVCCAGIGGMTPIATPEGPMPLAEFRRLIDVNLVGVFNLSRLAAAAMIHNPPDPETGERGVIINTSSIAATDGRLGTVAYSASKAGVAGMTLPMARDLSGYGIRVMAIAPGLFDTPLLLDGMPDGLLEQFYRQNEFPKRGGDPDEFARLVQLIVETPYLNAEMIRIDAGIRGA